MHSIGMRLALDKSLHACLLYVSVSLFACATRADEAPAESPQGEPIDTYRSGRLELRTDLPAAAAEALVERLETTLRRISRYWRRPLGRRIVLFVADDLSNWPDEALPHPQARMLLRHVRGGTELQKVRSPESPDLSLVAHVYATSERGIAEHELVHAYCMLAFGTCGPEWYKEGMAEMACYDSTDAQAVACKADVARMLRSERGTTIAQIIDAGKFTQPIAVRLDELRRANQGRSRDGDQWEPRDTDIVHKARRSYHRSWALCYFLANNPNYQERFRQLGICYLNRMDADFNEVFADDEDKLAFEFALFLKEIDEGYRVDLCHWNWKREFSELGEGEVKSVRVLAARGYQPSGMIVSANEVYDYVAEGRWTACRRRVPVSADGSYLGQGCLEGVIVNHYTLSEPFHLGTKGSFVAQRSGQLFLRCRDDWYSLADNEGRVEVRLRKGSSGSDQTAP